MKSKLERRKIQFEVWFLFQSIKLIQEERFNSSFFDLLSNQSSDSDVRPVNVKEPKVNMLAVLHLLEGSSIGVLDSLNPENSIHSVGIGVLDNERNVVNATLVGSGDANHGSGNDVLVGNSSTEEKVGVDDSSSGDSRRKVDRVEVWVKVVVVSVE